MHSFTSKLQEALQLRDDVWGPLQTPGRTDKKIVRGQDPEKNEKYRSHVGALNWLTMCLRYDLTYTTKELSRVLQEPTKTSNEILKRALNYTIQTKHAHLLFRHEAMQNYKPPKTRHKPTDKETKCYEPDYNITDGIAQVDDREPTQDYRYTKSNITQVVLSDIDLAGQVETRQSTSGLMVYLNGVLVHWRGRTERLILQTTAAGEYVALNRANTTAKFIRDILQFYGNTDNIYHLYTDNQAAEHIATQPTMNEHSRAIDIRHHAIRQDYIENKMRIGGIASEDNTSDILTKNLQPPLHQKHCAGLHILQPTLTNNSLLITTDSHHSTTAQAPRLTRHNTTQTHGFIERGEVTKLKQWCAHTTKMPKMKRLDTATCPHDTYQDHPYTCHSGNTPQQRDTRHPKLCKNDQFLDMFLTRPQKDSWAHSGFDRDALRFKQPRFGISWGTSIPMFLGIEKPRDMTISRDNTLPWVHPSEVPARKHARKTKKQESKKFYKNLANQSPSLISQKCLKISKMSKKDETVDQSENCRLRMPENFCQEQGDATIDKRTRISPPLALPADSISPQNPHTNFLSEENDNSTTMPAIRRAYTRTFQPSYSPYSPLNTDIYSLQASILDTIQELSAFTMSNNGIQMDTHHMIQAIRLLVRCDTALETTQTSLQITLPGSKFQYYRPVFNDYEEILQRHRTLLIGITNVSDETRQMALNQLDDAIPPPPPDSPPLSPSSPEYSPVYWSPDPEENDETSDDNDATQSSNTDDQPPIID
jgi:hypothetical protein